MKKCRSASVLNIHVDAFCTLLSFLVLTISFQRGESTPTPQQTIACTSQERALVMNDSDASTMACTSQERALVMNDSDASTIVFESSEERSSPMLLTQCSGCSDNMENQQAHYQSPENPHGCISDSDSTGGCDADEWPGIDYTTRRMDFLEGVSETEQSEDEGQIIDCKTKSNLVSEDKTEDDDKVVAAPPASGCGEASMSSGKSVGSVCRMQHVYKRVRAQLLHAKQAERRAKIVWAAVKQWCETVGVIDADNKPIVDFEYDANVRAAADMLVAMGVPLRHLNVWERQSLQTEREDPILGMHY
jgi:hypothetical protein